MEALQGLLRTEITMVGAEQAVAIEAQRLGVEVIAVDRYANAPAMQVCESVPSSTSPGRV